MHKKIISILLILLLLLLSSSYSLADNKEDLKKVDRLSLDVLLNNGLISQEQYDNIVKEIDSIKSESDNESKIEDDVQVDESSFDLLDIKVLSQNSLRLKFSQPVVLKSNPVKAFKILSNGIMVELNASNSIIEPIESDPYSINVLLKNGIKLNQGDKSQLSVSKLYFSKYGSYFNDYKDKSVEFIVPILENQELKVVDVTSIYNDTLRIDFNQSVDLDSAIKVTNYSIFVNGTKIKWMPSKIYPVRNNLGEVIAVNISTKALSAGKDYAVECGNVLTVDKLIKLKTNSYSFTSASIEESKLWVESVDAIDSTTIALHFNRSIALEKSGGYVNFSGSAYMTKMHYGNTDSEIIINLNSIKPLKENKEYNLTVSGFVDKLDKKQEYSEKLSFYVDDINDADFSVNEAYMVSENRLILKFSKEIDQSINDYSPFIKVYYYTNANNKVYKRATNVKAIDGGIIALTLPDEAIPQRISIEVRHVYDISKQHRIDTETIDVN